MVKKKIELSVIIPVYNVKSYLNQCVCSIAESAADAGIEPEVLLIDDGSTDGSGQLAEELAVRYPFVRVIHQENRGVAAARNKGMEEALGSWLFFVDSDDWVALRSINIILSAVSRYPEADIILFDAWEERGGQQVEWAHFTKELVLKEAENQGRKGLDSIRQQILYPKDTPLAAPWDKIYRKEFLKRNRLMFPENLKVLDDMVFNMEAFGKAEYVVYQKEKIYHYQRIGTSITNSYRPDRVKQDQRVWEYIEKYLEELRAEEKIEDSRRKELEQCFYCRTIKSFAICFRLCFFHENNPRSLREKLKEVKKIMKEEPYGKAFQKVKVKNLEWRLKLVWLMAKGNCALGMGCLYFMNQWMEKHGK